MTIIYQIYSNVYKVRCPNESLTLIVWIYAFKDPQMISYMVGKTLRDNKYIEFF